MFLYGFLLSCPCNCFHCWGNIGENVTNTELTTVKNIGVPTLRLPVEDGTDAVPTAIGNISVSTPGLEYARYAELTAVENIGVSTLQDGRDPAAVGNIDISSTLEDGADI